MITSKLYGIELTFDLTMLLMVILFSSITVRSYVVSLRVRRECRKDGINGPVTIANDIRVRNDLTFVLVQLAFVVMGVLRLFDFVGWDIVYESLAVLRVFCSWLIADCVYRNTIQRESFTEYMKATMHSGLRQRQVSDGNDPNQKR